MNFKESGKNKAITFSYDDGVTQDIFLVELMNKYGLKGTFNLNSGLLGRPHMLERGGRNISHYKVHPKDVRVIYEGHEIAAHTKRHPNLTKLEKEEIIEQVEQDRLALSELAGYEVVGMAYPCGGVNNDERVADIIKENTGIVYSRTITSTQNFELQDNLYRLNPSAYHLDFDKLMQMGEEFINLATDTPKIFYIWGHSYELDFASDYPQKLEAFFELISGRDDIFYGTNKEVLL